MSELARRRPQACTGCGDPDHIVRSCHLPPEARMAPPSNTERSRKVRDRRLVAGLCVDCGREPRAHARMRGEKCLKKDRDRQAAKKVASRG